MSESNEDTPASLGTATREEIDALYDAAWSAISDENNEGVYLHHASPYLIVKIIDELRETKNG